MKLPLLYVCFAMHAVQVISSTLFHYFFVRVYSIRSLTLNIILQYLQYEFFGDTIWKWFLYSLHFKMSCSDLIHLLAEIEFYYDASIYKIFVIFLQWITRLSFTPLSMATLLPSNTNVPADVAMISLSPQESPQMISNGKSLVKHCGSQGWCFNKAPLDIRLVGASPFRIVFNFNACEINDNAVIALTRNYRSNVSKWSKVSQVDQSLTNIRPMISGQSDECGSRS